VLLLLGKKPGHFTGTFFTKVQNFRMLHENVKKSWLYMETLTQKNSADINRTKMVIVMEQFVKNTSSIDQTLVIF
jgi:hypothetical protein